MYENLPVPTRYLLPDSADLWSDQSRYKDWASVEVAAAKAQGAPHAVLVAMSAAKVPTPEEVTAEEETTGHDVVAFLNVWKRGMEPRVHAWVHRNMTSSDLVDSALAVRLVATRQQMDRRAHALTQTLARHALAHRRTLRVGRTHGQVAEVTTWGWKIADLAFAMVRAHSEMMDAFTKASVPKLSGPVGDYKLINRYQEATFASKLVGSHGSMPLTATQVVYRDRLAQLVFACARTAAVIESLAIEVRLSMRSEVGEVFEGGASHRIGSSAMPHKKNPVTSENLTGLSRLVRAQIQPMLEDVALHHERDISHSSVERVALPTALLLTDFMMHTARQLVDRLVVNTDRMSTNLETHRNELQGSAARCWLVDQGVHPDAAWDIVRASFDAIEDSPSVLDARVDTWVASETRRRMREGSLKLTVDPEDFAPDWIKMRVACELHNQVGHTSEVYQKLSEVVLRQPLTN